jgi:hypothetical protein
MDEVAANKHIPVLVAPDKGTRGTPKRWLTSGRASSMRTVLRSEHGHERHPKRKQTAEPLSGNTKHNSGFYRFHRRGRTNVRLEWRLPMMTHNITKAHRRQLAALGAETAPQRRAATDGTRDPDDTPNPNGPSDRPRPLRDSLRPQQQ